jgi:hypothetical protein
MRALVESLAGIRAWVLGPPVFVDAIDDEDLADGDEPIETIGLVLTIRAPRLADDREQQQFDDVAFLVEQLKAVTVECDLSFELEINNEHVGGIEKGDVDRSLAVRLLGEWKDTYHAKRIADRERSKLTSA